MIIPDFSPFVGEHCETTAVFVDIAKMWTHVSDLFESVTCANDTDIVQEASETLASISQAEQNVMMKLYESCAEQDKSNVRGKPRG